MNEFPTANEEQTEINLTPMLDVVFIMLIFFVVTATFVREYGFPAYLSTGLDTPTEPVESIVVTVEADNSFHVNGRVVAQGSLASYIKGLAVENPDAPMVLRASNDAYVEATVFVLDAGRHAGFSAVPIENLR